MSLMRLMGQMNVALINELEKHFFCRVSSARSQLDDPRESAGAERKSCAGIGKKKLFRLFVAKDPFESNAGSGAGALGTGNKLLDQWLDCSCLREGRTDRAAANKLACKALQEPAALVFGTG